MAKPWGKPGEKRFPEESRHIANFIRTVRGPDGNEVLAVHGMLNSNSTSGSVYLFEPMADTPFHTIPKLPGSRPYGDFSISDINGDGTDEITLGTSITIQNSAVVRIDLRNYEKRVLDLSGFWREVGGNGYRVAQAVSFGAPGNQQILIAFGSRIIVSPPDFSLSDDGVWVNLYGSSVLDTELPGGGVVKLTQETDFPWDGTTTIAVHAAPEAGFVLQLRIPGWADSATVTVNGEAAESVAAPGTYAAVKRHWRAGDTVALELPLRPRLIMAHPEVEEAHNQIAVMRGPMVYCLEGVDLPDDVPVHEVHIPRDIELTARFEAELLGGVTVLEGTACRRPGPDWSNRLYAELPRASCDCLPIRLIPYYAWLNRGRHDMRVWLPLQ